MENCYCRRYDILFGVDGKDGDLAGEDSALPDDQLLSMIGDQVLPYIQSLRRQLGKSSSGGKRIPESALADLGWIVDMLGCLCRELSTASETTKRRLLASRTDDGQDSLLLAELSFALQDCYSDILPILLASIMGKSSSSAAVIEFYSATVRLYTLATFHSLLRLAADSDAFDALLMELISRAEPSQESFYIRLLLDNDTPLLVDYAHLYQHEILRNLRTLIDRRNAENKDPSQLEFCLASFRHWIDHVRCDSLVLDGLLTSSKATTVAFDNKPVDRAASDTQADEAALDESLISAVKDLFPDLGNGFIEACLLHYDRDLEKTIAALCDEDSLAPELKMLDRNSSRTLFISSSANNQDSGFEAAAVAVPAQQKDLINGLLAVGQHRAVDKSTKQLLDTREDWGDTEEFKFRIMQAVDNDENDDADEGDELIDPWAVSSSSSIAALTVNENLPSAPNVKKFDSILMSAYASNQTVFDRKMRKCKERQQLREKTGLTDEQIEGWRIMLERNPKRDDLMAEYSIESVRDRFQDIKMTQQQESRESLKSSSTSNQNRTGNFRGRGGRGRSERRKRGHDKKMTKGMGFLHE